RLLVRVPQLEQSHWHSVVNDLNHPPARQFLVFNQRQIRLYSSSVAVHHEADGAGGSEYGDLGIAIAEFLAVGERFIPALLGAFVERRWNVVPVDVVHRGAMHADDIEERLAVDVPARASGARHNISTKVRFGEALLGRLGCWNKRFAQLGDT